MNNYQNPTQDPEIRIKKITMKNQVNKIIRAYRLFKDRHEKLRITGNLTNYNTSFYNNNNYTSNNNYFNNNEKKEDNIEDNLNINESMAFISNQENNLDGNQFISQDQYMTEQSSSSLSFLKTKNYIGVRDSNGLKTGFGIEKKQDGTIYKGVYQQDKLEGYGIQIRDNGTFKGEFEEGRTCGYGISTMKNGVEYNGEWIDEMLFGVGYEIWRDKSKYEGEYNNGAKNGIGTYYTSNGKISYQGEWNNNNMEGFGIYTYPDGKEYIGEWKGNKMEGYGEFYMNEGRIYFGFFKNDKREGFGIHYFPENTFYVGFWKAGKQHGMGKYISNDTIKYGFWNLGKKTKYYQNEEEFLDNLDEQEKRCEIFFKWDINKLKAYLRFEGYDNEENGYISENTKKKKLKKGKKKHQRNQNGNEIENLEN